MKSKHQGSHCGPDNCPRDYEFEQWQRRLAEDGLAEIPVLRPQQAEAEPRKETSDEDRD